MEWKAPEPIRSTGKDKSGRHRWLYECNCGRQFEARKSHVAAGAIRSCGCYQAARRAERLQQLVGKIYGRLTVVKYLRSTPKPSAPDQSEDHYLCKCECGALREVLKSNLFSGNSKSCGCLARENASKRATKHGMFGKRFYTIYRNILDRCTNPKNISYQWYGARGIKLEWHSFEDFSRDMYESYLKHSAKFGRENTTIDRIDPNKNYCKSNCGWATYAEQSRNRRTNRVLTFKGETKCLVDWAKEIGVNSGRLSKRLDVYGWSVEKTLTTPGRLRRSANGNGQNARENT